MEQTLESLEYPVITEPARPLFDMSEAEVVETSLLDAVPTVTSLAQAAIDTLHQGDVLDRLKELRSVPLYFRGLFAVFGITSSAPIYAGSSSSPLSMALFPALAAVTPAVATAANRRIHRRQFRRDIGRIERVQQTADLPIELFRKRKEKDKYELDIRLYDTKEEQSTGQIADTLFRLQKVAVDVGAAQITLPASIVGNYLNADQRDRYLPEHEWLDSLGKVRGSKKTVINYDKPSMSEADLFTVSVEELGQLAEHVAESEPVDTVPALIGWIRQAMPNHPAVALFDKLWADPDVDEQLANAALADCLGRAIERRLDNVQAEMVELTAGQGRVHRQKQTLIPELAVDSKTRQAVVNWHKAGQLQTVETTSLLAEHNVTVEQLEMMLCTGEALPANQIVQLCELAGWMHLKSVIQINVTTAAQIQSGSNKHQLWTTTGLQSRFLIKHRAPTKAERKQTGLRTDNLYNPVRRIAAAAFVMALGLPMGLKFTNEYAHNVEGTDHSYASERYFAEGWIGVQDAVKNNVFRPLSDVSDYILPSRRRSGQVIKISSDALALGKPDGTLSNGGGQGNNQPIWQIESQGNMSSEGYWSSNVFHNVSYSYEDSIRWSTSDVSGVNVPRAKIANLPNTSALSNENALQVTTNFDVFNSVKTNLSGEFLLNKLGEVPADITIDPKTIYARYDVPVLLGTRLAAIDVDNAKNFFLLTDQNGLQQIVIETEQNKVEQLNRYWLIPEAQAARPIKIISSSVEGMTDAEVLNAWADAGENLPNDQDMRLQASETEIKDDFTYDLSPFDSPESLSDITQFVTDILETERAKCDSAATLLAITNRSKVTPVTGYLNSNTPEQHNTNRTYLSIRESHMWTVDAQGNVHDATPSSIDDSSLNEYFVEDFKTPNLNPNRSKQLPDLRGPIQGAALVASAGLTLSQRRRLARIAYNTALRSGKLYSSAALSAMSDQSIVWAHAALNHRQSSSTYQRPVLDGKRLPFSDDPATDARQALQWRSTMPAYQKRSPRKDFRGYPTELRRDLRQAERTIRHMQRMSKPLRPKK